MSGFFVTGTDTGVGKTIITGALARALRMSGRSVGVFKPVESGCAVRENELVPEDAVFLKKMACCPEDLHAVCPYRMKHALAPGVAAALEGIEIDVARITAAFRTIQNRYDIVLVEGAGGLMVPVAGNLLTSGLITALKLPLLVVARLSLGTINHTLLTVKQAQHSGISVAGIILNQLSPETRNAEDTNPAVIRKFTDVPIIGQMPYIPDEQRSDADCLAAAAADSIDFGLFTC